MDEITLFTLVRPQAPDFAEPAPSTLPNGVRRLTGRALR